MALEIVREPGVLQCQIAELRQQGLRIGLVPTMGFLHEGHLSLMRQLRPQVDKLLVSLFVNPTQFGPGEDLDSYPRNLEKDISLCETVPVDQLFIPAAADIYPAGYATYVDFERYTDKLCGNSRPGHFRGVGTVVLKLIHICQPHLVAFGRKDAQQLFLIKQMVKDFQLPVEIVEGDTVREADGLAMSSRNSNLQPQDRIQAAALSQVLQSISDAVALGERDTKQLTALAQKPMHEYPGFELEYLEYLNWETFENLSEVTFPLLTAIAGRVGRTRLIDNVILNDIDDAAAKTIVPDFYTPNLEKS
jgi:pantoate--beta-alanine ligase